MPKDKNIKIFIDEDLCKGCGICLEFCGKDVFEISDVINRKGYYLPIPVNVENCSGCLICELMCPELGVIIEISEKETKTEEL